MPNENSLSRIDLEALLYKFRYPAFFFLLGAILIGLGLFINRKTGGGSPKVEIINEEEPQKNFIIVEIAGAVEKPGVYQLPLDARIEDLLVSAGGVGSQADRNWLEKNLNRAAKLIDGQKIYIPGQSESFGVTQDTHSEVLSAKNGQGNQTVSSNSVSQGSGLININTASPKELESLNGIGPVYAQSIIEHRPYSNIEDLVSKGALKEYVYQKIKDQISTY